MPVDDIDLNDTFYALSRLLRKHDDIPYISLQIPHRGSAHIHYIIERTGEGNNAASETLPHWLSQMECYGVQVTQVLITHKG